MQRILMVTKKENVVITFFDFVKSTHIFHLIFFQLNKDDTKMCALFDESATANWLRENY